MTVRVRFAPSPTGNIHIGNVRAAIFNKLFALKHGGKFILRLEDTDRVRSSEESAQGIMSDLRWLGLAYDEGPDIGGPFAPYRQMGRLPGYQARARDLVKGGHAYPCFCDSAVLRQRNAAAAAQGADIPPAAKEMARELVGGDDGEEEQYVSRASTCPCGAIPADEALRRMEREGAAIRFRGGGRRVRFNDTVFGEQEHEVEDFIILKSDGIPTYHFGVVCDDHDMEISNVIRGRDHLTNTAKHVALFEAFGWDMPRYAHYSLTSGLSKRDQSVSIRHLKEHGYLPQAILNCALLLGWSPNDGQEFFDPWSKAAEFDLRDLKRAESAFDRLKFDWLAGEWMREGIALDALADLARPRLAARGWDAGERLPRVIAAVRTHLKCLADVPVYAEPFFVLKPFADEVASDLELETAEPVLAALRARIEAMPDVTADAFRAMGEALKTETGAKGGKLWRPVRGALWARAQGPELPLVAAGLGQATCLERIDRARSWIAARRAGSGRAP